MSPGQSSYGFLASQFNVTVTVPAAVSMNVPNVVVPAVSIIPSNIFRH
jgi:hypothetical protein